MYDLELKLQSLSDELNISETKYENAVTSYKAIADYLNNHLKVDIKVFPQGSFKLGTVIKPLNDSDGDYDIDLVCVVDVDLPVDNNGAKRLKESIGNALKESDRYKKLIDPIEGGKRCWTLRYANDYHLDILPTIKHDTYNSNKRLYMTNKTKDNEYEFLTTNPELYFDWFNRRNVERKRILDEAFKRGENIDDVPDYKYRSTLQKTIQIIKRYRDIMFKDDQDNKPISIIITTILALLYEGESQITYLIKKFIENYKNIFTFDQYGNYILKNPVNQGENFADKWIDNPIRKENFFKMMNGLSKDFMNPISGLLLEERDRIKVADGLKTMFGNNIIDRLYELEASKTRSSRTSGQLYVSKEGKLNTEDGIKVKDHTFHGED